MGFGIQVGGWGGEGWGGGWSAGWGGAGPFGLFNVIATAENIVTLFYQGGTPYLSGLLDPDDASTASHYTIEVVPGSEGYDGNPTQPVTVIFAQVSQAPFAIDLLLDRPMSPFPSQYTLTIEGIWSTNLSTGLPAVLQNPDPAMATYYGVYRELQPQTPDVIAPSADFANPQSLAALVGTTPVVPQSLSASTLLLGTYVVDQGDYATDQGLISYKKRVLRRGVTVPGAFAFLPRSYGVGIPSYGKKLQRGSIRAKLAAAWQAQILEEPETATATVTQSQDPVNPGLVYFMVSATTKNNQRISFRMPVPVST